MNYKKILEHATAQSTFRLSDCLDIEGEINNIDESLSIIRKRIGDNLYESFKGSVIRTAFFIELTNLDPNATTDSTKYQVRWVDSLKTINDARYANYEQCIEICEKIFKKISKLSDKQLNILKDYCTNSIFSFELPIDYISRNARPFHCEDNIDLFIVPAIERCTLVRKLIKNSELNPKAAIFSKIISQKIKVKAYQTDRAQTGIYKTNREKRWESHPENYQFAFRRDCNDIEANLILQVCTFDGVDEKLIRMLVENGVLSRNFKKYKCPITGEILKYNEFEKEILNRVHGKSSFQVGHLNPLKSTGLHIAKNIGWISDDGNRIQGSLTMDEVNQLLIRIYNNRPELRILKD